MALERGLFARGETPVLANADGQALINKLFSGVFKALFLLRCGDYAAVAGLAHKFRTQSGRQIISSYHSQLAIQLSRPTPSLLRLLQSISLSGLQIPGFTECTNSHMHLHYVQGSRFAARGASPFQLVGVISTC